MGDVPYKDSEEERLIQQLGDIADDSGGSVSSGTMDDAAFLVHVGDFGNFERTQCEESYFEKIGQMFRTHATLPVMATPGDNDWNDCPDPTISPFHFREHFSSLETHVPHNFNVHRSTTRPENFAFLHRGVLVVFCNLVAGNRDDDWDDRVADNLEFLLSNADANEGRYRAVVVFGHSMRNNFMLGAMDRFADGNIPVAFIHGNGHAWEWTENRYEERWKNLLVVMVDRGGNAPPIKVTVRGTEDPPLEDDEDDRFMFGDWLLLDRRGGLYEDAT